jgi:hypothetical protein
MKRGWMVLRATRDRTMKTPKQNYNPFDVIAQRLKDINFGLLRVTVSRPFADRLIAAVVAQGSEIVWRGKQMMYIKDDKGTWPAIHIRDDLDGDVFIIENARGKP